MNIFSDLGKTLSEDQIKSIASLYNVPYASVKAVVLTEAQSSGFYAGTMIPIVRFENHIFHQKTNGYYTKLNPEISSAVRTNQYNKNGYAEFVRFQKAYRLDSDAAIWSTSWGIGQIMGFNYDLVGCKSLNEFASRMFDSELSQINIMFEFIRKKGLISSMQTQNWKHFALIYNGPKYAENQYDKKLEKYFNQYS